MKITTQKLKTLCGFKKGKGLFKRIRKNSHKRFKLNLNNYATKRRS